VISNKKPGDKHPFLLDRFLSKMATAMAPRTTPRTMCTGLGTRRGGTPSEALYNTTCNMYVWEMLLAEFAIVLRDNLLNAKKVALYIYKLVYGLFSGV
jgi:hypothetical protein